MRKGRQPRFLTFSALLAVALGGVPLSAAATPPAAFRAARLVHEPPPVVRHVREQLERRRLEDQLREHTAAALQPDTAVKTPAPARTH